MNPMRKKRPTRRQENIINQIGKHFAAMRITHTHLSIVAGHNDPAAFQKALRSMMESNTTFMLEFARVTGVSQHMDGIRAAADSHITAMVGALQTATAPVVKP